MSVHNEWLRARKRVEDWQRGMDAEELRREREYDQRARLSMSVWLKIVAGLGLLVIAYFCARGVWP